MRREPRPRTLRAAAALGFVVAPAVIAAACGLTIGDLVVPTDASEERTDSAIPPSDAGGDTGGDAGNVCLGSTCDADTQCCSSQPRCTAGGQCAPTCTELDADCTTGLYGCCSGLRCENKCMPCIETGKGCAANSACCSGSCVSNVCRN